MSEIIKVCLTHGDLTRDQVDEQSYNNGLSFNFKCKQCRSDAYRKNIEKRKAYSKEYERTRRKRPDNHYADYVKIKSREWRQENSDLVNARVAADREKDPEKYRNYDRKWRAENIKKARLFDVVKNHNITYDEYLRMIDKQQEKCAICNEKETKKSRTKGQLCRLAIDHDHKTGNVRELLCHECNTGLGKFKDNVELLKKAILYLEKHSHTE